jgi:hypothetical protein
VKKQNTEEIVESTTLLAKAFSAFFEDDAVAREVAFNLADIEPELMDIHGLLQKIKKTGKANGKQVERIIQAVCIHWKYHGEEIRKLVSGLGKTRERKTAGAAGGPPGEEHGND